MAEAGASAIDDAGVDLLQHIISQAQLLHGAGTVVLDHHVGLLHHLLEDLLGLGGFQVQGDAHLTAVKVGKVNALIIDKGAHAPTVITLARLLDLDNRSAHIRQNNNAFQQAFFVLHDKPSFSVNNMPSELAYRSGGETRGGPYPIGILSNFCANILEQPRRRNTTDIGLFF